MSETIKVEEFCTWMRAAVDAYEKYHVDDNQAAAIPTWAEWFEWFLGDFDYPATEVDNG
jgi:hypothetical protein